MQGFVHNRRRNKLQIHDCTLIVLNIAQQTQNCIGSRKKEHVYMKYENKII